MNTDWNKFDAAVTWTGTDLFAPEMVRECTPEPFARPLAELARLLGYAAYHADRRYLLLCRPDDVVSVAGEISTIEIDLAAGGQPRLEVEYIATATDDLTTFRSTGLRPLTLAGLRKALKHARRLRR